MTDSKKFKARVRARMERTGESYTTAKRNLESGAAVLGGHAGPEDLDRVYAERHRAFRAKNLQQWKTLTERLADRAARIEWRELDDVLRVLNQIGREAPDNHMHMPVAGGLDLTGAAPSHERGCIELRFDTSIRLVRPAYLSLTMMDNDPGREWAYFWLETARLERTGIDRTGDEREELVEIAPGDYRERWCWDEGRLGYDEYGHEIPLPSHARLVIRVLSGSFLIVTKAGGYNSSDIYDGRHNRMGEANVRAGLQQVIDDLHARGLYGQDLWGR